MSLFETNNGCILFSYSRNVVEVKLKRQFNVHWWELGIFIVVIVFLVFAILVSLHCDGEERKIFYNKIKKRLDK